MWCEIAQSNNGQICGEEAGPTCSGSGLSPDLPGERSHRSKRSYCGLLARSGLEDLFEVTIGGWIFGKRGRASSAVEMHFAIYKERPGKAESIDNAV
jgi:hypothetical protein